MGKREAVIRICNEWQEREHAQADEGAYSGRKGSIYAEAGMQGSTQSHGGKGARRS